MFTPSMRGRLVAAALACLLPASALAEDEPKETRPPVAVAVVQDTRASGRLSKAAREDLTDHLEAWLSRSAMYALLDRAQLSDRSLVCKHPEGSPLCCRHAYPGRICKPPPVALRVDTRVQRKGGKCALASTLRPNHRTSQVRRAATRPSGCVLDDLKRTAEDVAVRLAGGEAGAKTRREPKLDWVWSPTAGTELMLTEVTVRHYEACLRSRACPPGAFRIEDDSNWSTAGREDYPMNYVEWSRADAFCKWAGGRLPTQDEWYAEASWGGRREFPWGPSMPTCSTGGFANKHIGCETGTWHVCTKPAGHSVTGICDLLGNVGEWTSTKLDGGYVVRGGPYFEMTGAARLSPKSQHTEGGASAHTGFRCARDRPRK